MKISKSFHKGCIANKVIIIYTSKGIETRNNVTHDDKGR